MYTLQKRVGRDGTIGNAQGMKPPRTSLSPPLAPNFLKISMHFQNLVFYFQAKLKGLVHQMLNCSPITDCQHFDSYSPRHLFPGPPMGVAMYSDLFYLCKVIDW